MVVGVAVVVGDSVVVRATVVVVFGAAVVGDSVVVGAAVVVGDSVVVVGGAVAVDAAVVATAVLGTAVVVVDGRPAVVVVVVEGTVAVEASDGSLDEDSVSPSTWASASLRLPSLATSSLFAEHPVTKTANAIAASSCRRVLWGLVTCPPESIVYLYDADRPIGSRFPENSWQNTEDPVAWQYQTTGSPSSTWSRTSVVVVVARAAVAGDRVGGEA